MRIRRISENKIQIIITRQDLEARDFNKGELMPLGPKTQKLFQDLLDLAYHECGFEIEDDSQLMVEAYPLSIDSIVIIMTKIRAPLDEEVDEDSFLTFWPEEADLDEGYYHIKKGCEQVWSFADLENCIQACSRLNPECVEQSALYKYKEDYYLAVVAHHDGQKEVAAILGEYGDWQTVHAAFFAERAQTLIPREAVVNLASLNK